MALITSQSWGCFRTSHGTRLKGVFFSLNPFKDEGLNRFRFWVEIAVVLMNLYYLLGEFFEMHNFMLYARYKVIGKRLSRTKRWVYNVRQTGVSSEPSEEIALSEETARTKKSEDYAKKDLQRVRYIRVHQNQAEQSRAHLRGPAGLAMHGTIPVNGARRPPLGGQMTLFDRSMLTTTRVCSQGTSTACPRPSTTARGAPPPPACGWSRRPAPSRSTRSLGTSGSRSGPTTGGPTPSTGGPAGRGRSSAGRSRSSWSTRATRRR